MSIAYFECVCSPVVQQAKHMRCIIVSSVDCLARPYFFTHYLINGTIFGKFFIIIIVGSTALGGPWPSEEDLSIHLCWGRVSFNSWPLISLYLDQNHPPIAISARKMFTRYKICILIFSTTFVWNICHSQKNLGKLLSLMRGRKM